jgi:hypothetical protein
VRFEAAKTARAGIHDAGPEWRVSADCPGCRARLVANLQPGPWTVLDEDATPLGPDGHTLADADTFGQFEARRAAGKLRHRQVAEVPFELWCFRCDRGVTVTVHTDAGPKATAS